MTVLQKTITAILGKMSGINKSKRDFLTHVLCLFLIIRGKANFLHLGRYSDQYVERVVFAYSLRITLTLATLTLN